jgi:hypothetical protein
MVIDRGAWRVGTSWNSQKQEQPTHAISKTKEMMAERG